MTLRYYANAPATTLSATCSSGATVIEVDSVAGLPIQHPYTLILDRGTASEEVVSVTGASGTSLTIVRGFDDTPAFAHAIGAVAEHGISAIDPREANAHVNASDGVHGVSGDVVGTTDEQTLTNKTFGSGTVLPSSAVTLDDEQALTNKDLSDGSNTFPGSLATTSALSAHTGATDGVHGVTGDVVGTTDTQTLTNKTIGSGSVIAASVTNYAPITGAIGETKSSWKTADEARTGTTLAVDNDLTLPLAPNARYLLLTAAKISGGDFKGRLIISSGGEFIGLGASGGTTVADIATSTTLALWAMVVHVTSPATGATLRLQWAQNSAAGATTLKAYSGLTLIRIG